MQRRRPRQSPQSCQSCRSKKLRCNRVQPCSNCSARGVHCTFLVPPETRQSVAGRDGTSDQAELTRRLSRLESLVLHADPDNTPRAPNTHSHEARATKNDRHGDEYLEGGTNELIASTDLPMLVAPITLEGSTAVTRMRSCLQSRPTLKIAPTDEILARRVPTVAVNQIAEQEMVFPPYDTASRLFEGYLANTGQICRVLHVPSTHKLIRSAYLAIELGELVAPGQAALLLSIFALSALFFHASAQFKVAPSEDDAVRLSRIWHQATLDLLDHSQRSSRGSLEDVQACILASYAAYHLDGVSAGYRMLTARAASLGRDLRLHRVDAGRQEQGAGEPRSVRDRVQLELKRRVFWRLATSDWLQSTISGPQEGVYSIHPNHTRVKLPRDCNDEDVGLDEEDEDGQQSGGPGPQQPTTMTFFLAIVKLAHLCREMTDAVPIETSEMFQRPYEDIMSLDSRFDHYFATLPFFYRTDEESRRRSAPLETVYPNIPRERYWLAIAAHSRRCRLHQKFMLRQSADARYAYSRVACLRSARAILGAYEEHRRMEEEEEDGEETSGGDDEAHARRARMPHLEVTVHFTHLALLVMVMDLCFNREVALPGWEARRAEVAGALRMVGGTSRSMLPSQEKSLGSLHAILRKHGIELPDETTRHGAAATGVAVNQDLDALPQPVVDVEMQSLPPYATAATAGEAGLVGVDDFSADDFWQQMTTADLSDATAFDSSTWDSIFSAVDSRPF